MTSSAKTPAPAITALIAEDEPLLAQALCNSLKRLWPELRVLPSVSDGTQAVELALAELPDICFLDIQMPERDGLAVAEALAEQWPQNRPLPRIVFVTAYDEYAVAAFERSAVDYLLKPVQTERLARTCSRLQERLRWQIDHHAVSNDFDEADMDDDAASDDRTTEDLPDEDSALLSAVRALSAAQNHQDDEAAATTPLRVIPVAVGQHLQFIDVNDVLYFEAADKYVRLVIREAGADASASDLLIRTPLRELIPRLNGDTFWQIHRSVVVNITAIDKVSRQNGRLRVHIRQRPETLEVSRMYAPLFRPM